MIKTRSKLIEAVRVDVHAFPFNDSGFVVFNTKTYTWERVNHSNRVSVYFQGKLVNFLWV